MELDWLELAMFFNECSRLNISLSTTLFKCHGQEAGINMSSMFFFVLFFNPYFFQEKIDLL